ncbi:hypothetical protein EUC41_23205 [Achromobacter denitrificans]|nr:hypothetical protein [Achromobacter denitrificans]WFC70640.1 hypothetical protein EUC41_23205 [Achromobacter denitrificans]
MPQYGTGPHGRYFTLTLEQRQGSALAAGTPYRLFLTDKSEDIAGTPTQDGILHGVTDAQGRTAWVWTREAHSPDDFTLIRRIGDGPWGHFFHLHSSGKDKEPVAGWPYITTMRMRWGEQWVDLGYTSREGNTAYFSHATPAGTLSLSIDSDMTGDSRCFGELDAVNRKFSQGDADGARQLIDAMRCTAQPRQQLNLARLLLLAGRGDEARGWADRARQWRFPESLKPLDPAVLRDRYALEKLLGRPAFALADARALQRGAARTRSGPDWANSIAYYLADFPEYLAEAEEQARVSVRRVGPKPYNQATLGWILALRGDARAGLALMKQSYRDIPRDEEMVADYGLALWRDGQRDLATRLWDEARAQCVWGQRLHTALREAGYPHPYFQPAGSRAVQAYQEGCARPRIKPKTAA